ncbi:MAG: site-2 protease family protein [Gemmatimonadota bacterium]|nr:site-2 protease family protein [Gemmatimonadota bacterium]
MDSETLKNILLIAPVLLFSMVAHEYAHGYAALRQGDPTAYELGRLTWNPAKHIDPFMTIIMPAVMLLASGGTMALGGAKPVPVDPRNYRDYRRGDIIVSLAGVATNFVIALACTLLILLLGLAGSIAPGLEATLSLAQYMMFLGVSINMALIFFNLLPIPPLDGSHVMKYLLPPAWSLRYQQIGAYGFVILIVLISVGRPVLSAWMSPAWAITRGLVGSVARFIIPGQWPV